jgi:hypothetical protein
MNLQIMLAGELEERLLERANRLALKPSLVARALIAEGLALKASSPLRTTQEAARWAADYGAVHGAKAMGALLDRAEQFAREHSHALINVSDCEAAADILTQQKEESHA